MATYIEPIPSPEHFNCRCTMLTLDQLCSYFWIPRHVLLGEAKHEAPAVEESLTTDTLRQLLDAPGDLPAVDYTTEGGWKFRKSEN